MEVLQHWIVYGEICRIGQHQAVFAASTCSRLLRLRVGASSASTMAQLPSRVKKYASQPRCCTIAEIGTPAHAASFQFT